MKGLIHISYWLGIVAGVLAVVYRVLLLVGVGASWPEAMGVTPGTFLRGSVLALLVCLATEVYGRTRTAS